MCKHFCSPSHLGSRIADVQTIVSYTRGCKDSNKHSFSLRRIRSLITVSN